MEWRRSLWIPAFLFLSLTPFPDSAKIVHPVFKPDASEIRAEELRAKLKDILNLEESALLALIPTRTGFISADCPNCEGGAQGLQLEWKISDPLVLTCRYCGEKYPSPKYPDDKIVRVKDPLGRIQEYPYYLDPAGRRRFFQARGWRIARDYFMLAACDLALLYHASGDRRCAARAAMILDRFAELYPGFIVTLEVSEDENGFQESPPYNPQGGKWGRWYYDEIPTSLVYAYDLIYDSGELEKLGRAKGIDVKRRIEEDFFRGAVKHVRTYPEYYANPSPRIYEGLAAIGRVIGEPEIVHDAVRRLKGLFENRFFFDGMWKEGSYSYHRMTMSGLESSLKALGGYSDPAGFADPVDGTNFEVLDMEKEIPMLARARRAAERFCYPDGRFLPVHDSWSRFRGAYQKTAPLMSSRPALWAGMGHAYLGRGKGKDQMQAGLQFGGGYGHHHNDSLSLSLFACGEELLPDLGYSHTRFRSWTKSTLGHNTLMVDGEEQDAGSEERPADGDLILFLNDGDDFQVLEASASKVYPGRVRGYSRALVLIGVDETNAYLVDIFSVTGGARHELVFHASAEEDKVLDFQPGMRLRSAALLPPGVSFEPPANEYETGRAGKVNPAYGFLKNTEKGDAPGTLTATFQPPAGAGPALRIWILAPPESEIISALAPSIRRADENDSRIDQFWTPLFLVRKEGKELSERYVSVMEPFGSRPFIQNIRKLDVQGGGAGVCISGAGWTDYLLYQAEGSEQRELSGGGLRQKGRIGWVRLRDGKAESMRLVNGTSLRFGGDQSVPLSGFGAKSGRVRGVVRKAAGGRFDALEVDARFPGGTDAGGQAVVVKHGDGSRTGHILEEILTDGEKTFLVLADEPGFEIMADGGSRFLFFPRREIQGTVSCLVPEIRRSVRKRSR